MSQLESVLNTLKSGKARDPNGISREIFRGVNIGTNLKESILTLCNKIKKEGKIPKFMLEAQITTIPKKGPRSELRNERGIFLVNSVRGIIMRLLFNSESHMINDNMSDSNIGGRKQKSCINHIWALNSIVHEQLSSKKYNPVVLQQYDYQQMFDSMHLKEACADLYDIGLTSDKLSLVYNANRNIKVRVKTPSGVTNEMTMDEIVMQGDTWASTMASVQCDAFGKELLEEEASFLYKYKGVVPVGILGQIDDLIGVTEAGYKAQQMNSYINVKTADKYLQFGPDKCKSMLVGSTRQKHDFHNPNLEVDTWNITHNKEGNINESFGGKTQMEEVQDMLYLGVVISCDGNNSKNINHKQNRALGTQKQIMSMVKGLGSYTAECGFIYLNSILRGSILYATETMMNIKEKDFRHIEQIEEDLMRKLFSTDMSCPIHLMYLEAGQTPARFQIKRMILIFYQYILQQKEESMMFQMLAAQITNPTKNDFNKTVNSIFKEFEISYSINEIKNMKKKYFQKPHKEKMHYSFL